ncbi:hypothetical protein ACIQU4_27760 [Streptomyces sp. NPDC090741]|uniref:Mom family adenine methylcarbamoylation protein n=1 Tax=Streptomyces sp. NPDC090741 TaxID=3365967 RepID=UPI00380CE23C
MGGVIIPRQEELLLPSVADWCQRWSERRPTWRRTSEGGFDPSAHRVVSIPETAARSFVERHHYSGAFPVVRFAYGLQRIDEEPGPGEPPGGRLLGVLTLGIPMNGASLDIFENITRYSQSLELNRLVLLDRAESNAESWFCARSFVLAARRGIRGVVAYSDPVARIRKTEAGDELVSPGHIGHVYAAQDFAYLGKTRTRRITLLPDATVLADRAATKVRRGEQGHRGVEERLVRLGATPRRSTETGADWLTAALATIGATTFLHGGNHRYARTIGPHRTRLRLLGTTHPPPRAC